MESIYDVFCQIKKESKKNDLSRKELKNAIKKIRKEFGHTGITLCNKDNKFMRINVASVCDTIIGVINIHRIRYHKNIDIDELTISILDKI